MLRIRRTNQTDRRGAAAVELALILPIFMMVVMGIVEFGRAMMVGQLVTNAARHGARVSVIDGSTNAEVIATVEDFLVDTVGVARADITINIEVSPGPGNPDPLDNLAVARTKDVCRVSASIPYAKVGYISGSFLNGSQLRGACSMRHE